MAAAVLGHPKPCRKLLEGRMFLKAEQLVGIAVERLPFPRALDDCPCKPAAHAYRLRVVEVATAPACGPLLYEREDAIPLTNVGTPVASVCEQARIEYPAQDDKRAHL